MGQSRRLGGTLHVCAGTSGALRMSATCRSNEQPFVLSTESGITSLRAALEAADAALTTRIGAVEGAGIAQSGQIGGLFSANTALADRVDALESRLIAFEQAALTVTFTKGFDGGHYASYIVRGTGLLAGSIVVSGVGTTAAVADNGTFSIFGGNLFCDETVIVAGTDATGAPVVRSAPVDCNSEDNSLATATFTKSFDGGHYASYTVTGKLFQPGSMVVSGVGTTATVADDGTFSVFGGNLFCSEDVTVSGTDWLGNSVTRSAPVVCDSE